ncbi:MAG: GNAT family N-acetyltransferase [Parcubacteria group bacterium]|nr:GNAT family N-acetyltransferase [Parcubacteria group bacterium]
METKTFGDKKITIRKITKADIKNTKKFQDFINFLVGEEAKILINQKMTLKAEKVFLEMMQKGMREKTKVYLAAECDNKIVGSASIELNHWRKNHIGKFGIAIIQGYRGIGLGKHLMSAVVKLAKKNCAQNQKLFSWRCTQTTSPRSASIKRWGLKLWQNCQSRFNGTENS